MEFIIGAILAIIIIITVGLILRKKLYDGVDKYEARKLEIMNRNVAAELSKMKDLNMDGETKENFETWKEAWDTILTEDLAKVEELLYDTEKAADKYSFPTAKKHMKEMDTILLTIEEKVESLLKEIQTLLKTEANNRELMETIEPQLQELRKFLSQNRYKFNKADIRFETAMDKVKEDIDTYYELIEHGNYIEATDKVVHAEEQIENIKTEMDEFPALYKKAKQEIPEQLDELLKGINDMGEQGYSFNQTSLLLGVGQLQSQMEEAVQQLENEGTEAVKQLMQETEDRITNIYDDLETEALARNFIETKLPEYENAVDKFDDLFDVAKEEVRVLTQAYHFNESDLEKFNSLDSELKQIHERLKKLQQKVSDNQEIHSVIREELETAILDLQKLEEEYHSFKKRIENLRKDELEARNELQILQEKHSKINRQLRHSNLPGIPNFVWRLMEETSEKNNQVLVTLEQKPINISEVQHALSEAKSGVDQLVENADNVLEQASLTEHVIQYANRYRSADAELAKGLKEAERLFHKAEYELALENAARALEAVEPGALKRIEKSYEPTIEKTSS